MNAPAGTRWRLPQALRLFLQLLITGLITWFILKAVGFDLDQLRGFDLSSLHPRWGLVLFSCLGLLGVYLYTAALWGMMVKDLGGQAVGMLVSMRVLFTANLGRYVPGKLWQIAGVAYLAKGEGVPPVTGTGAAVLGQAFSLAGATLVGAGVLLENAGPSSAGWGWGGLVLLVLVLAATSPGILKRLLPFCFRLARQEAPGGFRPDPAFGFRWLGLYALSWVGQGLAFWILARGFGFEITILQGATAYAAAYVAGYLFLPAPAGVGIREGLLVAVLGPILGPGAAVLALVSRLWSTVVELLPAVGFASSYMRRNLMGGNQGV